MKKSTRNILIGAGVAATITVVGAAAQTPQNRTLPELEFNGHTSAK